jgi:hypothetical protein
MDPDHAPCGRVVLANLRVRRYQERARRLGVSQRASFRFAAIAQLVEHVIRNDGVGGSSPSCGTI